MRDLVRKHALLIVVGAAGLVAGADYAVATLFRPDRAVMHDGHFVFAECNLPGAADGNDCVAQYEFILGNTGRREERVVVAWPADIRRWTRQPRTLNIAADEPRGNDPDVTCETPARFTECRIERFAPGTLLIMQLRCMPCGRGEIAALRGTSPEIRTSARVYRGDPRVNALVRRLQVLFH